MELLGLCGDGAGHRYPHLEAVKGRRLPDGRKGWGGGSWRLEQHYHFLVPIISSPIEWCLAMLIPIVRVNVAPFKQYFHHPLLPILSTTME